MMTKKDKILELTKENIRLKEENAWLLSMMDLLLRNEKIRMDMGQKDDSTCFDYELRNTVIKGDNGSRLNRGG